MFGRQKYKIAANIIITPPPWPPYPVMPIWLKRKWRQPQNP